MRPSLVQLIVHLINIVLGEARIVPLVEIEQILRHILFTAQRRDLGLGSGVDPRIAHVVVLLPRHDGWIFGVGHWYVSSVLVRH